MQSNYQMVGEQHAIELFAEDDERTDAEKEHIAALKEHIESILKLHTQHSFLSFISAVQINDEKYSPPCIGTLIVANKSPVIISKIKHFTFMIQDCIEDQTDISIGVFLKV